MTASQTPFKDRRLSVRRPPKSGVQLACRNDSLGLGPDLAVSIFDLSETGVRLVLAEACTKGQELQIELLAPGQGRPQKLLANVVWCQPRESGDFWVGAQWRRRLTYGEIGDLTIRGASGARPQPPL